MDGRERRDRKKKGKKGMEGMEIMKKRGAPKGKGSGEKLKGMGRNRMVKGKEGMQILKVWEEGHDDMTCT